MSDPSLLDNTIIQNTQLYKIFALDDIKLYEQVKDIRTNVTNNVTNKLAVVILAIKAGVLRGKALNILTDSIFVDSILNCNVDKKRLFELLKFEVDPRVDTSFEMREKYRYVNPEEYEVKISSLQVENQNLQAIVESQVLENEKLNAILLNEKNKGDKEIDDLKSKIVELEQENEGLINKINDVINENDKLQDEIDSVHEKNGYYQGVIDELEEKLEKLKFVPSDVIRKHEAYRSDVNPRLMSIINGLITK